MSITPLSELLKLPAKREAALALTPRQEAELDRRWAEHVRNPESAVPWEDVLQQLRG